MCARFFCLSRFPKKRKNHHQKSKRGLFRVLLYLLEDMIIFPCMTNFYELLEIRYPTRKHLLHLFLLQDVMATSQSQLPQHVQKDNDVTIAFQTLFVLIIMANHPLLCNTTSIPGPSSSTPREYVPFRLPFSLDLDRMCIQAALFMNGI